MRFVMFFCLVSCSSASIETMETLDPVENHLSEPDSGRGDSGDSNIPDSKTSDSEMNVDSSVVSCIQKSATYQEMFAYPTTSTFGTACGVIPTQDVSFAANPFGEGWKCSSITNDDCTLTYANCHYQGSGFECNSSLTVSFSSDGNVGMGFETLECNQDFCNPTGQCIGIADTILGSNQSCGGTYAVSLTKEYVGCTMSCDDNCTCPNDANACSVVCGKAKQCLPSGAVNADGCEPGKSCVNDECQ
jgi:hypothetical protein